jgi:ABC-2 type transport system ATP-binding protein
LTKDYGRRRAIDNLNFDAKKGEVLGFLGPNGAGKTTTMRILTGYMPPTSGKATIAGYDVVEQSLEVRRRVGYLPETVPLYPDMTVFDYLKFMADLHGVRDVEDRADEVLALVHLEDRADSYIHKMSKGMRQRIGLAQALMHRPEVLILDEPTIGLDPVQIVEVRSLIREIGRERTVLLSTHILSEVQQLCDRVLIIKSGKIVTEDTPQSLQARLTGAQRAVVRVGNADERLTSLISAIQGISSVSLKSDGVEFEIGPGLDLRPEVARVVVNGGYDLLELALIGMSMEDIFLELTRDEPLEPELAQADEFAEEAEL